MSQIPPPVPPQPQAPAKKGVHPLVWVAVGCGALLLIAVIVVMAGGFFIFNKAKKFAANPEVGAIQMMVAANPDLEIVTVDEGAKKVTIRNKKTGEVLTMDFSEIKEGKFKIAGKGDEKFSIETHGEGSTGNVQITTEKGTTTFGADASSDLPSWIPAYPGTQATGTYSATVNDKKSGGFSFKTSDSAEKVLAFYESEMKGKGFEPSKTTYQQDGATGGFITAKSGGKTLTVTVTTDKAEGGTNGMLAYEEGAE